MKRIRLHDAHFRIRAKVMWASKNKSVSRFRKPNMGSEKQKILHFYIKISYEVCAEAVSISMINICIDKIWMRYDYSHVFIWEWIKILLRPRDIFEYTSVNCILQCTSILYIANTHTKLLKTLAKKLIESNRKECKCVQLNVCIGFYVWISLTLQSFKMLNYN